MAAVLKDHDAKVVEEEEISADEKDEILNGEATEQTEAKKKKKKKKKRRKQHKYQKLGMEQVWT